ITDDLQLKNLFGYTKLKASDAADTDASPYFLQETPINSNRVRQISDEIQLLGKALDGDLSYVLGFYYYNEHLRYGSSSEFLDLTPYIPVRAKQNFDAITKTRSYAGYLQTTYNLADATGIEGLAV